MFDFDTLDTLEQEHVEKVHAEALKAGQAEAQQRLGQATEGPEVRVCTYNLLAPCYFRDALGGFEAQRPEVWRPRLEKQLVAVLTASDPDILCLQELWFDPEALRLVQEVAKRRGYELLTCRRPERGDGCGMMVRSSRVECLRVEEQLLCQEAGRVLLKVVAQLCDTANSRGGVCSVPFVIGCTHLTHPNGDQQNRLRMLQAFHASRACREFAKLHLGASAVTVLAGDFNAKASASEDIALQVLTASAWKGAYSEVYGLEATFVSHRAHHRFMAADWIFAHGDDVEVTSAAVLPASSRPDAELPKAHVGAACALRAGSVLSSLEEWAQLSDHRPVVATLNLGGKAALGFPQVAGGA